MTSIQLKSRRRGIDFDHPRRPSARPPIATDAHANPSLQHSDRTARRAARCTIVPSENARPPASRWQMHEQCAHWPAELEQTPAPPRPSPSAAWSVFGRVSSRALPRIPPRAPARNDKAKYHSGRYFGGSARITAPKLANAAALVKRSTHSYKKFIGGLYYRSVRAALVC